ncbi:MAG: isopentenyl transferase family protein, partial [Flavobacteriaceae bacterium]|nr:isopentenyl transferase family protein [Flavobacteriaceae bacterium]
MSSKPLVIVIAGPTAIGKTTVAIELAQQLNTDIFSADSRQFYQEMYIGTAVPSPEELKVVKHHFIQH